MKSTFICMDGLAGHPLTTFREFKQHREANGDRVVIVDDTGIRTHKDRVARVIDMYRKIVSLNPSERIFLVGQSAGGSAVRIAAEKIGKDRNLAGVIMLSTAMPFGINYMTPTLARIMAKRGVELVFKGTLGGNAYMRLTENEHTDFVSPILASLGKTAIALRSDVPLKEARTLAFWTPRLGTCNVPMLLIHGGKDKWIAPKAQVTLFETLKRNGADIERYEIPEAGHITLLSEGKDVVFDIIKDWTDRKS